MRDEIVLIGPVQVGKSTVGELIAEKLKIKHCNVDKLRWKYYDEIGYDRKLAETIKEKLGFFDGLYRYWKPFEAYAIERILQENYGCVFDFGGGHSVYENDHLFKRVKGILADFSNVILLLPSPNLSESIATLKERLNVKSDEEFKLNLHFLEHHSNYDLAKLTIYTNRKSPEETTEEILQSIIKNESPQHPS